MAYDVKFLRGQQSAYDSLATQDNKTFYFTEDENNFYIGSHQLNNDALNVADLALASKTNDVITISGVKEAAGKIAKSTDTTKDITFAKVAATGDAEDVAYAQTIGETTVDNVKDAIDALITATGDGVETKTVYMTDNTSTVGTDYATIYKIYQGSEGSAASPVASELIGTINIPKDQFTDEAGLVDITFNDIDNKLYDGSVDVTELIKGAGGTATAADAGTYFKIVFAITSGGLAKSTIYISVKSLVNIYTSGSATTDEIVIAIDPSTYEITASVGSNGIAAAKIKITDTNGYFTSTDVEGALAEVGAALANMDAVADATKTAIDGDTARTLSNADAVPVLQSITEADGKITAMGVAEVAQIGSGTGRSGSGTEQDPYVYADTIKGAKKYTEDKVAEVTGTISDLDVTEFPIATDSNGVVTIHGISENDGLIAVGVNSANDVTLAKVATTGAAEDVEISVATAAKFDAGTTDVDSALAQLADALTWRPISS